MSRQRLIREIRPRVLPGAVFVCALVLAHVVLAASAPRPEDMAEAAQGVGTVLTGDSLRIDGLAAEVRLAGIQAPRGRTETFGAPFATEARDGFAALIANHRVSIRPIAAAEDRAGRLRAEVLRDDGLWLQAEMVRRGLARVALSADSMVFGDELLALERQARKARRGLWALKAYAVRDADDLARLNRDVGTYQVIAGTIASTARRGDFIYLNFGADYRSDMTAMIPREVWTSFNKLKPLKLANQRVQVRGWVIRRNGPAVELTAPPLIELLAPGF